MTQKRQAQLDEGSKPFRLDELRRKLTPAQLEILNEFWQHHRQHGKWPIPRVVHSQRGKQQVRQGLREVGGDIVSEREDGSAGNRYELTLIGVLLTEHGSEYFRLLVSYLEFLRHQYEVAPEREEFSDKDFREACHLAEGQVEMLGVLVRMGNLSRASSYGDGSWTILVPEEVEDLPQTGPLDKPLEDLLFKRFDPTSPALLEDRRRRQYQGTGTSVAWPGTPSDFGLTSQQKAEAVSVDALKRRYQVFVSSTYEDLKEERQHVIQALLETKCIPLGMELFPAASTEQWELIKRVIDECDYYMVVVAGRYGSLHETEVSYTELEFDYALKIGKPVIGFYHKDLESLPVSKTEKTDLGKQRLKAFSEKVRRKLCRPWSSPAELGSAVKSAIIHELEFNPKPGWIRADAVPSSEGVAKLKQKIADLEEKLKHQKADGRQDLASGDQIVRIPVIVEHDFEAVRRYGKEMRNPRRSFDHVVEMTWDGLVLALRDGLQQGRKTVDLRPALISELRKRLLMPVAERLAQPQPEFRVKFASSNLEPLLKTLTARKLVKMIAGDSGAWSSPKWRLTPRGLQHLAELEAIRG